MKLYFPDLVRSIDLAAEQKRIAGIKFAPRGPRADATEAEMIARRNAIVAPTTGTGRAIFRRNTQRRPRKPRFFSHVSPRLQQTLWQDSWPVTGIER